MPVVIRKRGSKYRIVEAATGHIASTKTKAGKKGKPRDGGGHKDKARAERQARAINSSFTKMG